MPIGVPKVEYRLPGEPEADWIDLYNCLYRERMLFLCQDLGDEVANQLISLMLYLNAEDPSQPFFMYINSLGGSVTCGIGVYDIMRYLESGITTICMGTASSMASFVLAGGTYGRRLSLPNGRIMIHQPEGGSDGQASEILSESSEVTRIRQQIGLIYATRTQQSIERIARDMDRDQFMSADEAKSYGLIDFVARTVSEPNVDLDILKLLDDEPSAPQQFRPLAAAQSLEQAAEAIRNLPETKDGDFESFRSFVGGSLASASETNGAGRSEKQRVQEDLEDSYDILARYPFNDGMNISESADSLVIDDVPSADPDVLTWDELAGVNTSLSATTVQRAPDDGKCLLPPNVFVVDGGIVLAPFKTMNSGNEILPTELPPDYLDGLVPSDVGEGDSFITQEVEFVKAVDDE